MVQFKRKSWRSWKSLALRSKDSGLNRAEVESAEKAADLGPDEVTEGCEERQKWLGQEPNILRSAKWVTFEMLFHLEVLPFGLILPGSAASVSAQAAPIWTEAKTHLCPRASSSPYPPHFLPPLLLLSEGLPAPVWPLPAS